jgi:alginate O-acetyltransferase complex protein AlgF
MTRFSNLVLMPASPANTANPAVATRRSVVQQAGFATVLGLLAFHGLAMSQTTGALYDPQPPADSAYVRVIVASASGPVDIWLDGKLRLPNVAPAAPSDYMVVRAGKHKLSLHPSGKAQSFETQLEVIAGRSVTVAVAGLSADAKPQTFEDKANTNKLKAVLTVYNLAPQAGSVDFLTADGATKVFSGVAPGSAASLAVNPITVELMATKSGDKTALAKTSLTLGQGQTYSLVLLPADADKVLLKSGINTLERYSGK